MKKWKAYIQLYDYDRSWFDEYEFAVTDEQFDEMNNAVRSEMPIRELQCYDKLLDQAVKVIEYDRYVDEWDKPQKEDYDTEQEYKEEMEEYYSSLPIKFTLARIDIDDPGDIARLEKEFIGQEIDGDYLIDFDEEGYERNVSYLIDVCSENGKISSITVKAEAMESDGIKGGSVHSCYPDYEQVARQIRENIAN